MARAMARVEGAWLINPADAPSAIAVGTPAWYVWLEGEHFKVGAALLYSFPV